MQFKFSMRHFACWPLHFKCVRVFFGFENMDGFWVRYVSLWISISNSIWIFELNSVCNAWWFLRFSRFEWYSVEYAICLWWRQPIHFKPQNASTISCAICHISTTFAQRKSTDVMKWEKKRPLKLETVCLNYAMPAAVIQRHYFPLKVDPNLFIFFCPFCSFHLASYFPFFSFLVSRFVGIHCFHNLLSICIFLWWKIFRVAADSMWNI